jgi:hypothetical protein
MQPDFVVMWCAKSRGNHSHHLPTEFLDNILAALLQL